MLFAFSLCALAQANYATPYTFTTFAGGPGAPFTPFNADGTGTNAQFIDPSELAVDSEGNVYVADRGNGIIRKVTPAAVVTTLDGETGSAAQFYRPFGVAVDNKGNVYVADAGSNTIYKVSPAGVVTTLAGLAGSTGTNDGTGSAAQFFNPFSVAVDSTCNVYVADTFNNTIRKVTSAGMVTTLAGLAGIRGSADGTGSAAQFGTPRGVAVDIAGNVYVADSGNNTIRKVTAAGEVTTLAGLAGSSGTNDGTGSAARFHAPWGIAVDSASNVYVADYRNYAIRQVTPAGVVTTLAGFAGSLGSEDGTGSFARFNYPEGVVVDSADNIYVADTASSTIRKGFPRIQAGIGSTVVQVGQDSALPVTLLSSVGITNLSFTLACSGNRLTNWTITSTNPCVETTTLQTVGSSQPSFTFGIQAGQTFQSPTLLGTIGFTALPGDSAFLPVAATNIIGINSDFGQMANITSLSGQVVAVGLHPLLAASLDTNSTRILNIYGNPGSNYQVAFSTNLASPNWQPAGSVLMTNLQQTFNVNQAVPQGYYHIQ